MNETSIQTFNKEDFFQVIVGSAALTLPVAFSEESWNLSKTLPWGNIIFIIVLSLLFINLYSINSIFSGKINNRLSLFLLRTIIDYIITLIVVFIILLAINQMPVFSEPIIAFKRIIILSFPASMGGVIVDSLDKE
ncbi:MAG: DUF2391 family protein [Saprospiraceae bacterium]|nr:DUF2391 family protein [Saprospiraceae bacterium]